MPFEVRVACDADCAAIARLECSLGRLEWDEDGVKATLRGRANSGLVALEDGQQIGHVLYCRVIDEVEILTVAVDSAYRRQGIGYELLRHASALTQAKLMHLEVRATNTPAIALYLKLGFENVGRRKAYYRDGEDAIVMRAIIGDEVVDR